NEPSIAPLLRGDRDVDLALLAPKREIDRMPGVPRDGIRKLTPRDDALAVDRDHLIAWFEASPLGRIAGVDGLHARIDVRPHTDVAHFEPRLRIRTHAQRDQVSITQQRDRHVTIGARADGDEEPLPGVDLLTGNRENAVARLHAHGVSR